MKTYYELLDVPATASVDDIKRNFRREIAKYHPDKVQHLGPEFQEIAATKAAELTQAYKALSDPERRAEYDDLVRTGEWPPHAPASAPVATQPRPRPHASPSPEPPPQAPPGSSVFSQDRAASSDLIHRATVARFRQSLLSEFGSFEEPCVDGFTVACVPKPPFWTLRLPPRVVGKFVPQVDGAAVGEAWGQAARMKKDSQRDLIVFVMGPALSAAGELAAVIAEQRKKPMPAGGKLTLVPVNTRTWSAHVPNDAPAVVKSLLTRLKTA
jgi:hypothetical protein